MGFTVVKYRQQLFLRGHKGEMRQHLIEDLHRFVELYIPQEWGQVLEEINQQLCIHGPTL